MSDKINPIREADEDARQQAIALLKDARTAVLAVMEIETGAPFVSRVGFGLTRAGTPISLVSDLAIHTRALRSDPRVALLIGEPGQRGDPLTHPRLTLRASARFIARDNSEHPALRAAWLASHPKAALYIDFADFHFVAFDVADGHLNAGFARAYALSENDLTVT
ncbi:hypothetical protein DEA8626_00367 [Defluviimonas aquaemixtae]|uniref:Pyridoxamine 5'-phosphate oxidase N-terminal domain-containing protein n=1 Tax=Albidovulum aquaemixtae TaxID=1542388 RepID=A0A2R8B2V3_9RHOB|nr:pyridoxamine 5'-phosphate oxidase family protein [Defluviimonas aquaemixtae]SPH16853.1 hypothetical protein DEA8626_00367 [Defluviimonas aquaemixtae]